MNKPAAVVTSVVGKHPLFAMIHGGAHLGLEIGLPPLKTLRVNAVIRGAPRAATGRVWSRYRFAGLLLLLVAHACSAEDGSGFSFRQTPITDGVFMWQGRGGNIGLVTGDDGVLIIDDDYEVNAAVLAQSLREFGSAPEFILNTHWHGDHTGGNALLGKSSTIIAHARVRARLSVPGEFRMFNRKFDAAPASALPVITFENSVTVHFSGQTFDVVHYPHGHADGDSVVFIQPANVAHLGDHYFSGMFPFVDLESGGDVTGLIANVENIIARLSEDAVIIPGHGPLSTLDDLRKYHRMLVATYAEIGQHVAAGLSLAQAQERGLDAQWAAWGNGFINQDTWIEIVYWSITKTHGPQ